MREKEINIKIRSIREDPEAKKSENIALARERLLALDKEGKLVIAPNQEFVGEVAVWEKHLFEPRQELGGQSVYEYFDMIFIGHGEGPKETGEREFKGGDKLPQELRGTMSELREKMAPEKKKVLFVVCGSSKDDKVNLTRAIEEYLAVDSDSH